MAFNPSQTGSELNDPTKRANELNDPQFSNQQGYFPYDLTHEEFITPRFGEVTPCMFMHTVPGDRVVLKADTKTILNQINGNLLSTINQYVDTFFVPLRSLYPTNYEKLIPNPTKGDDLPNMALPQFALGSFVAEYLKNQTQLIEVYRIDGEVSRVTVSNLTQEYQTLTTDYVRGYANARLALLATVFSRGQLLDYLGCSFDNSEFIKTSYLQTCIDQYFDALYNILYGKRIYSIEPNLREDVVDFRTVNQRGQYFDITDVSTFRDMLSTNFERGKIPYFEIPQDDALEEAFMNLYRCLRDTLTAGSIGPTEFVYAINRTSDPFNIGFINLEKPLAYQQIIAQYFTNDSIDNIFTSDLYMQLLRSVMFPADDDGFTKEPTFTYNGVTTEYDYISCGGTFYSLIKPSAGVSNRQYVWLTLMLLMRRSLRYGDMFSTARPNMLAVGDLKINVSQSAVSPIDVTKNLLMQRYLNAANYIGSGFLPYFASIYGVTPSDTGTYPRFISHRKIALANDVTTNTADDQGKQTTNIIGVSKDGAFDVFIDDIGVILCVTSYDVLPVYKSGIDNTYHFADRFDYFNPMLQGIGDQPIRLSEIVGHPALRNSVFGYTMRDSQYKYKVSRAHGAFVNMLPGYLVTYPLDAYANSPETLKIDPDFIRDKPAYLDALIGGNQMSGTSPGNQMSGTSPGNYYHFVVSFTNELRCARKIQATPPVLF